VKRLVFCLVLCVVVALLIADEAKKYDLVSNLKKGDSFAKVVKVEMKGAMEGGEVQEMNMAIQMSGEMSVEDVDSKVTATVADKITKAQIKGRMSGVEFDYDSDKKQEGGEKENPDPSEMIRGMMAERCGQYLNKAFKIKVARRWTTEVVEGAEGLEDLLPFGYLELMLQLPDYPVAIGDTWEVKIKNEHGREIELSLTLKEVLGTAAVIEGKIKKFDVPNPDMKVTLESSSYSARFNIEKGYPESVSLAVTIKAKGQGEEGGEVNVTESITHKCELKPKEVKQDEPKKEDTPKTEPEK